MRNSRIKKSDTHSLRHRQHHNANNSWSSDIHSVSNGGTRQNINGADIYTHFLKSGDRDAEKKIDAMFG